MFSRVSYSERRETLQTFKGKIVFHYTGSFLRILFFRDGSIKISYDMIDFNFCFHWEK